MLELLGEAQKTSRGFDLLRFPDANGYECNVQQSSAVDDTERGMEHPGSSFLWIGPEDANPKVLHGRAKELGIDTDATCGWVPFPVPDDVSMNTRMHLHRDQVAELVIALQRWLETGTLQEQPS